jgi:hypothetical protein
VILSPEELERVTGFKARTRQIRVLQKERIPFRVNGRGNVVVAQAAILRWLGVDSSVKPAAGDDEPDFSAFEP